MADVLGVGEKPSLEQIFRESLAQDPGNKAMEFLGQSYAWGWVQGVATAIERQLAQAGLHPDDSVGVIASQTPALYAAFIALVAGGRSMSMINSYQSPEGIGRDLATLGFSAVIAADSVWLPAVREGASTAGTLALALADDGSLAVVSGIGRPAAGGRKLAEPGIELLTSGTTGPPKRHLLAYRVLSRTVHNVHFALLEPGNGMHLPHQLNYPFAQYIGVMNLLSAIERKRWLWLEPKFSVERWLDLVRQTGLATYQLPPPGVKMVMDAEVPPEALAGVRYITCGAGAVDAHQRRIFEERYGLKLLMSYGATEYAGTVAAMSQADMERYGDAKFDSVGRAVYGVRIRIVDPESGEPLPPGEDHVGLVEVVQPAISQDWIRSTDLGCLDEEGFLYLMGRADGAINRGGFKVSPAAIQVALLQHPGVASACVVGVPDPRLGSVPAAAVERKAGAAPLDADELKSFVRKLLPATHIPVHVRIVDQLPRTATLKLELGAIREMFTSDAGALQA